MDTIPWKGNPEMTQSMEATEMMYCMETWDMINYLGAKVRTYSRFHIT